MQTLVYENYSKFIDATDAIRSIGQSVSVSERGLNTLSSSIHNIERNMRDMEEQLKSRRNEVAEKIRVKRLLTRLTRLLELPVTLKELCIEKKYRSVMKDYEDAMLIIGKHSEGFESLKTIEMDCGMIVKNMVYDLGRMVWVWCGGDEMGRMIFMTRSSSNRSTKSQRRLNAAGGNGILGISDPLDTFMRNGRMLFNGDASSAIISGNEVDDSHDGESEGSYDEKNDNILDYSAEKDPISTSMTSVTDTSPPQSISEIFECTGALLAYSSSSGAGTAALNSNAASDEASELLSQLNVKEYKVMSLECCTRYLEGLLDDHTIEVQEEKLRSDQELEVKMAVGGVGTDDKDATSNGAKNSLYPEKYLDTILEAATLYGVTFHSYPLKKKKKKGATQNDAHLLNESVSMWFTSFLGHVQMILVERISEVDSNKQSITSTKSESKENAVVDDQDDKDDAAFADVSHDLMNLLRKVREVASGLALPEIGLDMELASSFVEKTVGITESMVKRRVTQKFSLLRVRVLNDCLIPLVQDIINDESKVKSGDSLNIVQTVQTAIIALSDGMQMVDDTIRSILSQGSTMGMSSTPLDLGMVKVAVRTNARKFAFWLASALESIAGCDPLDQETTLNVKRPMKDDDPNASENKEIIAASSINPTMQEDDAGGKDFENSKEFEILQNLCDFVQDSTHSFSTGVLILALVEMCRLAGRNVSNNMNQSISSAMQDDTKLSSKKELFQTPSEGDPSSIDSDGLVSTRFRLAASRALTLYATMKGYEAVSGFCRDIWDSCSIQSEFFPHGPNEVAWKALEVAKCVSIDCAAAFGGDVRAGPIPSFSDDNSNYMQGGMHGMGGGARHGAMKGLSLDVARMFTQKVQVYPHHLEIIDFSRNAVVALILKIGFKSWIEQIRLCTFSGFAYRQLQVDVEFLKILLPHYIEEESASMEELQAVLSDVVLNAGERCEDIECVGVTEYYDEARGKVLSPTSIAMGFLVEEEAAGKRGILGQFLIQDDTDNTNESHDHSN